MIEGFLFPATYSFQPDETAKDMLSDMVKKFNTVITALDFKNRAQTKLGGIPPIEALIAASIAQKEATTPADMAGVTKVLYNRVFKGLANGLLGVDSETNYFLRMTGHDSKTSDKLKASELEDPNDPYNTHTVTGFPPGAISNPGEAALKAAVNPDPTKAGYGYFQTVGTNPKVIFSKTYSRILRPQQLVLTEPRRAAVLGKPIAHSLSPVLHNAGYAAAGLDGWLYTAIECAEAELAGFVAESGSRVAWAVADDAAQGGGVRGGRSRRAGRRRARCGQHVGTYG